METAANAVFKMLDLMTDTNFDGMRNHLDGKGAKREIGRAHV